MQNQRPEFFRLEDTDRKVLFWLIDNVHEKVLKGWMEYIAGDYKRRKGISIDVARLYAEATDQFTD